MHCPWLVYTVLIAYLTVHETTSQNARLTNNSPGASNYGDTSDPRLSQTSNQRPYQPYGRNNYPPSNQQSNSLSTWNSGNNNWPQRSQTQRPTWNQGNNNNYPQTPRPSNQWNNWNPGNSNNYRPTVQPNNQWPTWNRGNDNNYPTTTYPGNQWFTRRPNIPFTQPPPQTRAPIIEPPIDRGDQFDLLDFQNLPDSYRTAFMSVEELLKNNGMISPPGPNSRNVVIVFDNQTQQLLNPSLGPMVSNILPTLVPGAWRSMTYIQGCCSALRYHAANDTLVNTNGEVKKVVHFSKYSPPMYQFIPHGLCAHASYSTNGHCIQGTVTMSLLVYDLRFNPPISFDIFSVPSYCNCVQY